MRDFGNPNAHFIFYRYLPKKDEAPHLKHFHVYRISFAKITTHIENLRTSNLRDSLLLENFMKKYKPHMRDFLNHFKKDYYAKLNAQKVSGKTPGSCSKDDYSADSSKTFAEDHILYSRISEVDEMKKQLYLELMPGLAGPERKRESKSMEKEVEKHSKASVKKGEVAAVKMKKITSITA